MINESIVPGQGNTSAKTDYEFVDNKIVSGESYKYKLESVSVNGFIEFLQMIDVTIPIPTEFALLNNYPNPFNPVTNIKFQLPQVSDVKLVVYNMLGQKIRTLVDGNKDIGYYNVQWDGKNDNGNQVATGIYIYKFEAGNYIKSQKMILMK